MFSQILSCINLENNELCLQQCKWLRHAESMMNEHLLTVLLLQDIESDPSFNLDLNISGYTARHESRNHQDHVWMLQMSGNIISIQTETYP